MDKNLEVIITIGPPASGKSTWRVDFLSKNPKWVAVSRDDFRYMLRNQGWCEPKIEHLITKLVNDSILNALANNLNVIIDATNLRVSVINDLIKLVHEYADVSYRVFDVPYDTLIERDSKRERSVGVDVIDKMWKNWLILKDSFDFQPVKKARNRTTIIPKFKSNGLPDAIIFDIDGTLAINICRDFYNWGEVDKDIVNRIVAEHIGFHRNAGRKIIIVSGRDESCRKLTEEWLEFYGIKYDMLLMRPKNSFEKDTVIKKRIYESEIKDKYNVLAVYDDRLSVCEMWNELGLFVFNVNQGLKPF